MSAIRWFVFLVVWIATNGIIAISAQAQSVCIENGGKSICTSTNFTYGACDDQIDTVFAQQVFCEAAGGVLLQGGYSASVTCLGWAPLTEDRVKTVADIYYRRLSGVGSCSFNVSDSGWGVGYDDGTCKIIPATVDGLETASGRIFTYDGNYPAACTQPTSLTKVIGFKTRDICPAGNTTTFTIPGHVVNICSRPNDGTCGVGNPTQLGTGNKQLFETDVRLTGPNPLTFTRTYNSFGAFGPKSDAGLASGMLGNTWRSTYDRKIFPVSGSSSVTAIAWRNDGRIKYFSPSGAEIQHEGGATERLDALPGGAWRYTTRDDTIELYNAAGLLLSMTDRNGFTQTLSYNTASQLTSVTDAFGRSLTFTYDVVGRLVSVFDPVGNEIDYGFDTQDNLVSIGYPGAAHNRTYQYNGKELASITDENGAAYAQYLYDESGRVQSSIHAPNQANGTIDKFSFAYNTNSTTITSPLNEIINYGLVTTSDGTIRMGSLDQMCGLCGGYTQSKTYDTAGFPQSQTDFNGTATQFTYDDVRGLETQRIEAASTTGNPSPVEKRTIQTDWNPTFHQPAERRTYDASNTLIAKSNWTYNSRGQMLTRTETDPQNAAVPARTWTTKYCEQTNINTGTCPLIGLVTQVDGPRTDVSDITTYIYRAADDPTCASGGACSYRKGDLWKVTDALGHVSQYVSYDKAGRLTRIQDTNATYTDMTFHVRGWLLTRTIRANANGSASSADATTTFAYDNVGNVVKSTQPDGAYLVYAYDDAHRLTDISDNLANTIHYSLDAAGNHTQENTGDPNGVLMRTLSRSYDQLSRLHQLTDALNHSSIINYDGVGNVIATDDPLNVQSSQSYDALNRLTTILRDITGSDPSTHNATTHYRYDALDNLITVTDPNTLSTQYGYDALHDLLSLQSPDTGTATYTYDAAGNRITQIDARGVHTSYAYDKLNRLSQISYPTTSLNTVFLYDQSNTTTGCGTSYPIGRLTRFTDASGSTTYCYDRRGNVLKKTQVTGSVTLITQYSYSNADRLLTVSYPSGAVVTYTRNVIGQITTISTTPSGSSTATPLVSNVTYLPMGPMATLTYANGVTQVREYDQNYRIAAITDAGWSTTPPANLPANDYHYDDLYRLKEVDSEASGAPIVAEAYSYNLTGDRLGATTPTLGARSLTYPSPLTSHRLQAQSGAISQTRGYDAYGNSTAIGTTVLHYDDRNRLDTINPGSVPANTPVAAYAYNGKGERVSKSAGLATQTQTTTLFGYNEGGALLGEYSASGAVQQEYVYLEGTPVAVLKGSTAYYLTTDHLGTPRAVIDPVRNVAVWTWDRYGSAFGEHVPNQDADADGTGFVLNMRYPGQYFDSETGLNYNYFRDYEPGAGRYVESDPLGLPGGISTYAYVRSNPQLLFDSFGLEASYSGFNKDDEKAMRDANATAISILQSCNCRDCKEIGNNTNCIDELKKYEIIAELQFASYRYTPPNPAHPTYCAETEGKNSQIHPSALGTPPACCPLPAILADEAGHAIHLSQNHVAINWYLANCFHCGN